MIKKIKSLLEIKTLKTASALTGGRFFSLAVSIIILLIQSRFIGPETTGICQAYAIPVGYLWILTFGVPSALARELPFYLAKGDREKALKLAQTAESFSIIVGSLCACAFLVLSVRALILGNNLSAVGWGFQIIAAFLIIYNSYILTLYRTNDEFIKIAKSHTISAVASVITFPLIFLNPYLGIWSRSAAASLSSNIYLYIKRPFKFNFGFKLENLKPLIKFGIPLIAIGYIEASLWTSTQLAVIFKLGGKTYLGLFTFINSILTVLLIIPNAVAEILRPRFAAVYGESNGDIERTLKMAIKPLIVALLVSVIAIIVSWLLVDDIILWLLPKYVDAIPALGIAFLIVPIMAIKCIKYIFVVCKNMKYNLISTAPGFAAGIGLLYIFLLYDISFKYIFLPYVIGQLLNLVISFILINALIKKGLII